MKSLYSVLISVSVLSILIFAGISTHSIGESPTTSSCAGSSGHVAGSTGFSAFLVVDTSHSTVSGMTINAAGYDLGIYVCPGTSNVQITGNTVTGAKDHGIFVQDASHITVDGNLVTGNGIPGSACPPSGTPPKGCVPEDKGIQMVGTSNSAITNNVVSYNSADGGIGIADDGPQNPGAPLGVSGSSLKSINDVVQGNTIDDNLEGCGIVIAAYNAHVGLDNIKVVDNTIIGSSPSEVFSGKPAYIGQIVIATDGPDTTLSNTLVVGNSLDGSFLPGIVLHSNVFGDALDHTQIRGNTIAQNGYYPGPSSSSSNTPGSVQGTTGISIVAEVGVQPPGTPNPTISHTIVTSNTILGDKNGVWLCGTDHTIINNLLGNPTIPQLTCSAGGS
jgi:parallel beta-helix repeat protein